MHSQKRMFVILAVTLILSAATMFAATDSMTGVALKQQITFTAPIMVGGTLLPAGDYKLTHEMQGTEHFMVFKQIGGKAEVKAKCNLVPLNTTVKTTEQRYNENAKNERVLVEMQFRGDTAKHVLVQ
jgi:hypothetical protein